MKRTDKQLTARLIELRKAIKKKYKAFKDGTEESDLLLEKQYKPIIQELRKTTQQQLPEIKTEPNTFKEEEETFKEEEMEYNTTDDEEFIPDETSTPKNQERSQIQEIVSTPSGLQSATQYIEQYFEHPLTKEYMTLVMKDAGGKRKIIDHDFGPRFEGSTLMIGDKVLDFDADGMVIINNTRYKPTRGLYELLFKRTPDSEEYNSEDLKAYKSILLTTSAHKENYNFNGKIRRTRNKKYLTIIKDLFPTQGSGMAWKSLKTRDIVHWNDANELVARLRHIAMSTETGNRVHGNEILSIIEELREAGYIKGAGNSRYKALLK